MWSAPTEFTCSTFLNPYSRLHRYMVYRKRYSYLRLILSILINFKLTTGFVRPI